MIEHLSTHRHRRQDWILLTQSLTSLSVDVRKYAEVVIEVLNAKSLSLPWPLSISLRDVQTLLWGFGVRSQVYRTREGLLEGTYKVDWQGETLVRRTRKEIYALYKSTDKKQEGDSALPYADGPGAWKRALLWFFLKHGFKIILLVVVSIAISVTVFNQLHPGKKSEKSVSNILSVVKNSHIVDVDNADNGDSDDLTFNRERGIYGKGWAVRDGQYIEDSSSSPRR